MAGCTTAVAAAIAENSGYPIVQGNLHQGLADLGFNVLFAAIVLNKDDRRHSCSLAASWLGPVNPWHRHRCEMCVTQICYLERR